MKRKYGAAMLAAAVMMALAGAGCRDRDPQGPSFATSGPGPRSGAGASKAAASGADSTSAPPGHADESSGSNAAASDRGGAVQPFAPVKVTGAGKAMGTHLAYAAYTTPAQDEAAVRGLFDKATDEIIRLERLMTTWDPKSEVSQINASAGKRPVVVGQETFDVIAESIHASQISDGSFDITFQTLHGLWKFDEDLDPHPPTPEQVQKSLRYLGYRHVKLDARARSVYLDEPHVQIGLGGIAKGYAVDKASKVLSDGGLTSFFVQAGGDLYTRGVKPDGSPWQSGIRDPRGPEGDFFAVMPVSDHAFSTAGDYERSYIVDGKRYHHIIDPHTGYPATASRSVTIWAPNAFIADEIDDAVFILGPDRGLALVESLDGVGAVIVDAHSRVWTSKRLQGLVREVHPPRDAL
ncbi:MAG TPA: FAD:protein FMN transferase [Polyangiaceae bacterium]|nr:FAD:protein FMN transferase [Polyangiaceae bacterium]